MMLPTLAQCLEVSGMILTFSPPWEGGHTTMNKWLSLDLYADKTVNHKISALGKKLAWGLVRMRS